MIVETDQVRPSGQGTPMFSRCGYQTSNQYKVFAEHHPDHKVRSMVGEQLRIDRNSKVRPDEIDYVLQRLKVKQNKYNCADSERSLRRLERNS
jgi:hypothetical protein